MNKKKSCYFWFIFQVLVLTHTVAIASEQTPAVTVETFYGTINLDEMDNDHTILISDLLNSPSVDRLKYINQYGPIQMIDSGGHNDEPYSRYDHSLGVFYLLNRYGAPFPEQISGLLHDLPHSAFSHVSDYLFSSKSAGDPNYHDSQFISFVKKHGVKTILVKHQLSPESVDSKNNRAFTRLERPLPDLAADRLDYIIQGAARRQDLPREQVDIILADFFFDPLSEHWYSKSLDSARLVADASIELNHKIFATAWGRVLYLWAAEALRQQIFAGELSPDDIFFNMSDEMVWHKIQQSSLPEVQQLSQKMSSAWYKVREVKSPGAATVTVEFENVRCRVVDPRVAMMTTDGQITWQRVSDLDPDFKTRYQSELKRCERFYAGIEP